MAKLDEYEKSIMFDDDLNPILITEVLPTQELMMGNMLEVKGIRIDVDSETNEIKNGEEVIMLIPFNIQEITEVGR